MNPVILLAIVGLLLWVLGWKMGVRRGVRLGAYFCSRNLLVMVREVLGPRSQQKIMKRMSGIRPQEWQKRKGEK